MSAQAITEGWQAYRRAACIAWPDAGRREIGRATVDLWTALEMHGRLSGDEYPLPGLLAKYAEQARVARERLIQVIRRHCGESDARFVDGGEYVRGAA